MVARLVEAPYALEHPGRWLIARFPEAWNMLSWCVVNGGFQRTKRAAWLYLQRNELLGTSDPVEWMRATMHADGFADALGFMTSREPHRWVESAASEADSNAWAVGTVGMSNALRAGDPPGLGKFGTMNMLVAVDQALTTEGALEALTLISEAKALAVLESGVPSIVSNKPATGTGTDYLALAWPSTGVPRPYAGKHTAIGAVVGRAAYLAFCDGVAQWKKEQGAE